LTAYLLQIGFESFDETLENFSGYSTEKEISNDKIDSVLSGLSLTRVREAKKHQESLSRKDVCITNH